MFYLCEFVCVSSSRKCRWIPCRRRCRGSAWRRCGTSCVCSEVFVGRSFCHRSCTGTCWGRCHTWNNSQLYKNIKCLYLDFIPNRWEFFRFRSGHIKCQWVLESVASVDKFQRCVHRYTELKIFSIQCHRKIFESRSRSTECWHLISSN